MYFIYSVFDASPIFFSASPIFGFAFPFFIRVISPLSSFIQFSLQYNRQITKKFWRILWKLNQKHSVITTAVLRFCTILWFLIFVQRCWHGWIFFLFFLKYIFLCLKKWSSKSQVFLFRSGRHLQNIKFVKIKSKERKKFSEKFVEFMRFSATKFCHFPRILENLFY